MCARECGDLALSQGVGLSAAWRLTVSACLVFASAGLVFASVGLVFASVGACCDAVGMCTVCRLLCARFWTF